MPTLGPSSTVHFAISVLLAELRRDLKELAPTWKKLSTERKAFLRLLSWFELKQG